VDRPPIGCALVVWLAVSVCMWLAIGAVIWELTH
jgi:hypothetical protein